MEYENMRIAEFLAENWSKFVSFCEQHGDDPDEIYKAVSDED